MAVIRFVVISLVALAGFNLFKLIFFGQAFESEAQGIGAVIVMCLGAVTIAALETRRWLQKR